jgi:L-fuconolactonase
MVPIPRNIVDAHVHFWHPDRVCVPWVKNSPFDQRKDATEYQQQFKNTYIQAAVYVETNVDSHYGLVEADWISKYAEQLEPNDVFGGIGGIVAFAPVHQGDVVKGYLQTLMRITKRLRGVRYLIQDPTQDPNRILQPDFVRGIQCLESFGLSFDIVINCNDAPEQFPPLQQLVTQCPRVQFVLGHMGKPPCDSKPGQEPFEFWRSQIEKLASNQNVSCKVSGLLTELKEDYDADADVVLQLKPFVEVVRDTFGVDRIMFGGDWPMHQMAKVQCNWIDIICEITKDWSEDDKVKLFVTNATRIYRLKHSK